MNITDKTKIKEWYIKEYPDDELGIEINDEITFYDLLGVLDAHKDVYEALSVGDSIIRERVFSKLADILKVDYDYIYYKWLKEA